jgi:hypothetical protein
MKFALRCAWPPKASAAFYKNCKNDTYKGDVVKTAHRAVKTAKHAAEIKHLCKQIVAIQKKKPASSNQNVHVVMHQRITNAQGPDVMVLHVDKSCGYLDLFQVKNTGTVPTQKILEKWMHSLGLLVTYNKTGCIVNSDPSDRKVPAPMYTSKCLNAMVDSLSEALARPVYIRNRYLVIKQPIRNITESNMVHFRPLIMGNQVRIWTSDFLEPTFSAIPTFDEEFE